MMPSLGSSDVSACTVLQTRDLIVRFGGVTAVDHVSIAIEAGVVTGVIGPNGAGKTTFIDAISGLVRSTGEIEFNGRSIARDRPHKRAQAGIGRTFQGLELFDEFTVLENLLIPAESTRRYSFLRDLVYPKPDAASLSRATEALARLGMEQRASAMPSALSLGERKLVSIARALAGQAKVLLLDEPAAGLNTTESSHLGRMLRDLAARGLTVVLVDHDMGLVLGVCDVINVLVFGELIACGSPAEIRADETVIDAYLGRSANEPDGLKEAEPT